MVAFCFSRSNCRTHSVYNHRLVFEMQDNTLCFQDALIIILSRSWSAGSEKYVFRRQRETFSVLLILVLWLHGYYARLLKTFLNAWTGLCERWGLYPGQGPGEPALLGALCLVQGAGPAVPALGTVLTGGSAEAGQDVAVGVPGTLTLQCRPRL